MNMNVLQGRKNKHKNRVMKTLFQMVEKAEQSQKYLGRNVLHTYFDKALKLQAVKKEYLINQRSTMDMMPLDGKTHRQTDTCMTYWQPHNICYLGHNKRQLMQQPYYYHRYVYDKNV